MSQAELLRQAIKGEARRLGFDLIGVTTPSPPPHYPDFLSWLEEGYHGEMAYLDQPRSRTVRAQPGLILPNGGCILVLGMQYSFRRDQNQASKTLADRIAAYALGDDYHELFRERLETLAIFIKGRVGCHLDYRFYSDTGPILERDLAQRAGLGWIGKNTCLINPQRGSTFLLAELFLDLKLEPDPPFKGDHCGNCSRCLEACPTGAILPGRVIDSRRCISYLTIELKGPVPIELRPLIGDKIFGCDICQQVCPWNQKFAPTIGDISFEPRSEFLATELSQELSLSQEAFSQKFKGSPIKRARRRGYLRNVAIALGNLKDLAAVNALSETLKNESEPLVRGHCAWALGVIGGDEAIQALQQAAQEEKEDYVLQEICTALAGFSR